MMFRAKMFKNPPPSLPTLHSQLLAIAYLIVKFGTSSQHIHSSIAQFRTEQGISRQQAFSREREKNSELRPLQNSGHVLKGLFFFLFLNRNSTKPGTSLKSNTFKYPRVISLICSRFKCVTPFHHSLAQNNSYSTELHHHRQKNVRHVVWSLNKLASNLRAGINADFIAQVVMFPRIL